jgi:DNA-binding XRE family transcriptional regulator
LFIGSAAENSADMSRKGRHWHAKIQVADVEKIVSDWNAGGKTLAQIGEEYGVAKSTVSHIIARRSWSSVNPVVSPPKQKGYFSPGEVEKIRERISAGETQHSLAKELGVSNACISHIWRRVTAPDGTIPEKMRRLTEDKVREIRKLLKLGHSRREVADLVGASYFDVRSVQLGVTYRAVPE